jgi:outer membrane protein assembly factor BamD
MFRRALIIAIIAACASTGAYAGIFHHGKKSNKNPLANVNSKQPDKVLFDRAMDAMKHGKYDVARLTLQTLINTYPDSEYIARAKLGIGDAWYNEGGTTALAQAEIEYKDFITFFPNMPEAAEAQLKVANIHYRQMGKPDRDFTHARRAEDEYRQLILQFPDSKLVPQAEQRLREVQEVLAQREFGIGRFYYMRESYPAAIARLETLTDTYPLFSNADEALYMLGNAYEDETVLVRRAPTCLPGKPTARCMTEVAKGKLIQFDTNKAAEAYAKIVTRYPVMDRAGDAKHRLQALGRPVPTPTPEAIAQNKAEEASRSETGRFGKLMGNFKHGPDVAESAKVGQPTMEDPQQTSAVDVIRTADETVLSAYAPNSAAPNAVTATVVGTGEAPKSEPVPRSAPSDAGTNDNGNGSDIPELAPINGSSAGTSSSPSGPPPAASNSAVPSSQPGAAPGAGAIAGSSGSSSSTAAPAQTAAATQAGGVTGAATVAPPPAPPQVNEAGDTTGQDSAVQNQQPNSNSNSNDNNGTSTSKKKKKHGLHKLIPF